MKECFGQNQSKNECSKCFVKIYCMKMLNERCPDFGIGYSRSDITCRICVSEFPEVGKECMALTTNRKVNKGGSGKSGKGIRKTILEWLREGIYSDEFKRRFKENFGREASLSFYIYEFRRKGYNFEKKKENRRTFYKLIES